MSPPSSKRPTKPRQSAVIPVRRRKQSVQICLIRRRGSRAWGIPKGFIDRGETRRQAALKEAREEAGLVGRVIGGAIGMYDYDKRGATYTVAVYMMEVLEVRSTWLEKSWRERRWHSLERAALLLKGHPVRSILKRVNRLL
jgi:8-oxo-dGTP pyrophosphatase MutT (NUDIX family)